MSPREQLSFIEIEISTLVWEGHTNPEIARLLGTSEQVIKNHLRCIFDKLGVWSRLELALYVASHGGRRWALRLPATTDRNRLAVAPPAEISV
jgi:DNA-binding NarL/FixJ family response regulator